MRQQAVVVYRHQHWAVGVITHYWCAYKMRCKRRARIVARIEAKRRAAACTIQVIWANHKRRKIEGLDH